MTGEADFGQLAEDLSPEDLRSVLAVFATDMRRLLGNLNAAAAAGDLNGYKRVAHGLAGAAGAVGATALEQASRTVMVKADLDVAELAPTAASIGQLADTALLQLTAFLDRLDHAGGGE